jgi:hypothetical protein
VTHSARSVIAAELGVSRRTGTVRPAVKRVRSSGRGVRIDGGDIRSGERSVSGTVTRVGRRCDSVESPLHSVASRAHDVGPRGTPVRTVRRRIKPSNWPRYLRSS